MGNQSSSIDSLIATIPAFNGIFPNSENSLHPDLFTLIKAINAEIKLVHQDPLYKKGLFRLKVLMFTFIFLFLTVPLTFFIVLIWRVTSTDFYMPTLELCLFFGSFVGLAIVYGIVHCLLLNSINPQKMINDAIVPLVDAWNENHQDVFVVYKPETTRRYRHHGYHHGHHGFHQDDHIGSHTYTVPARLELHRRVLVV